jgi:hypothetical protein
VDDGNGTSTLPVKYQLPKVASAPAATERLPVAPRTTFTTAAERRIRQEAAAKAELDAAFGKPRAPARIYETKDIRVADTVRVIGRIDEYGRFKVTGTEWVRGVTVEAGAGGSIGKSQILESSVDT